MVKWDAVVLTACDVEQKRAYEVQIGDLFNDLNEFSERFFVYEDEPNHIRIGSGGATLVALNNLWSQFGKSFFGWHVLIIHSGGLSQRLPSASALGKVFMMFPNAKSFIEMKLRSYRPLLQAMKRSGVVICASDTLEYVPNHVRIGVSDVTLFAHPSTIEVAKWHGVYVLKQGQLWRVLQKPTDEELRLNDAFIQKNIGRSEYDRSTSGEKGDLGVRSDGDKLTGESGWLEYALTDSFFILSANIVSELTELVRTSAIECETCCYGDFLRALGTSPLWDYLDVAEPLAKARRIYADLFRGRSTEVVQLPENSFFHFGTVSELLTHFEPTSLFMDRFQITPQQCICSTVGRNFQIGERSIIELCDFRGGAHIGSDCVISGCSSSHYIVIPDRVIASTIILKRCTKPYSVSYCSEIPADASFQSNTELCCFVTIAFSIDDNLKAKSRNGDLHWFCHVVTSGSHDDTLWNVPLFGVFKSASESLDATLFAIINGPPKCDDDDMTLLSMADVLHMKNVNEMLNYRRLTKLRSLAKHC